MFVAEIVVHVCLGVCEYQVLNNMYLKAKRGFEVEFFRGVCPVFKHDLIPFQSMIT